MHEDDSSCAHGRGDAAAAARAVGPDASVMWFGTGERPLLGRLHVPESGSARGGVVICPPIGLDLSYTSYDLRLLAYRLQELGFAVLRFDYDGTGESAGTMSDSGRVRAWLESIEKAAALIREAGAEWVAGVGLRLGATLAAVANADERLFGALTLWEPYVSGNAFVREQRALQLAVLPEMQEDSSEGTALPGYVLAEETLHELRALELPGAERLGSERVLVLSDPARPLDARLGQRLGDRVEWQTYREPADIYDTGRPVWSPPLRIVEQVAEWIAGLRDAAVTPIRRPPAHRASGVVARAPEGRRIVETLCRLGPTGLFGILSEPQPAAVDTAAPRPVVIFPSIAAESSIGPVRQWVEISRRLAAEGFRCLRFDLSGIGESPTRPGEVERDLYAPQALDDIEEVAHAISPDDPSNVALVGVCSGAYAALAVAPRLRPRAVVAVNPVMTVAGFGFRGAALHAPATAEPSGDASLIRRARVRLTSVARSLVAAGQGTSWRKSLGDSLPVTVWRVLYAMRLAHSPARVLTPVAEAGVPTLLICGEKEATVAKRRTPYALRWLTGTSRFEEMPELNHSLLHAANRREISDMTSRYLGELFPSEPVSATASTGDAESSRLAAVSDR
jgi:alpha-beta hydrolase superfamily lysophospholipase